MADSSEPAANAAAVAPPATGQRPLMEDAPAWLGAALLGALLVAFAAPVPGFLDAGELVAASRELGVLHPPGHPAWLAWAALQEALPLGPVSARLAWTSALAAAAAALLTIRFARRLLVGLALPAPAVEVGAWAAAALLCASGSVWLNGTRVEVYALAWASSTLALTAAAAAGDRVARAGADRNAAAALPPGVRHELALAAAAIALGLLNHHYVALFALPAIGVAGAPALRALWRRRRAFATLVGISALCGLAYLALPLRAASDAELRWADPVDLRGIFDHIRAAHFTRSVTEAGVAPLESFATMLFGLVARTGPALGGLGLAGLVLAGLRPQRLVIAAWLALLGGVGSKALMRVDLRTVDDHGYALLAVGAMAVGVAVVSAGIAAALLRVQPRLRWLALAMVAALALGQVAILLGDPDTAPFQQRGADAIDDAIRAKIAPGGLYLPVYYASAFQEQAFRLAEGRRPDVVAAHLSFRTGDTDGGRGFARAFAARHPEDRGLARAALSLGRAPIGNLLERSERQTVVLEHDPDHRVPAALLDVGAFGHRLLPERERRLDYSPGALRAKVSQQWKRLDERLGPPAGLDHALRAGLLWQHALEAAHALRRGWRDGARDALGRARAIAPEDRGVAALDARLRRLDDAWARGDAKAFTELWTSWNALDFAALTQAP